MRGVSLPPETLHNNKGDGTRQREALDSRRHVQVSVVESSLREWMTEQVIIDGEAPLCRRPEGYEPSIKG